MHDSVQTFGFSLAELVLLAGARSRIRDLWIWKSVSPSFPLRLISLNPHIIHVGPRQIKRRQIC